MKNTVFSIFCMLLLCGCRQVSVDYTFAPLNPMAGETVTFTNLSTGGEDYEWNFGDNMTSEDKNPTHVFRRTGTYLVTLKEKRSGRTCNKALQVMAALPTFTASSDSISVFDEVRLKAAVWNPYKHAVSYLWTLDESVMLLSGTASDSLLTVCFTEAAGAVSIRLQVTMDGETYLTDSTLHIHNKQAPALILQTAEGDFCQRLYGQRTEKLRPLTYERGMQLLAEAVTANTLTDTLERKIYFANAGGLFVANTNGTDTVLIDGGAAPVLTLSYPLSRLFYASGDGVRSLPLLRNRNNRIDGEPVLLNSLQQVTKIVIDEQGY